MPFFVVEERISTKKLSPRAVREQLPNVDAPVPRIHSVNEGFIDGNFCDVLPLGYFAKSDKSYVVDKLCFYLLRHVEFRGLGFSGF